MSSILQTNAYKIIYLHYSNKAAHINSSVFNKMSKIFNQVLVSMSVLSKMGTFSCIANATFIYPPPSPPEYLIGFARMTQVVLDGPGEQLLHLLHTSYATGIHQCVFWWKFYKKKYFSSCYRGDFSSVSLDLPPYTVKYYEYCNEYV